MGRPHREAVRLLRQASCVNIWRQRTPGGKTDRQTDSRDPKRVKLVGFKNEERAV